MGRERKLLLFPVDEGALEIVAPRLVIGLIEGGIAGKIFLQLLLGVLVVDVVVDLLGRETRRKEASLTFASHRQGKLVGGEHPVEKGLPDMAEAEEVDMEVTDPFPAEPLGRELTVRIGRKVEVEEAVQRILVDEFRRRPAVLVDQLDGPLASFHEVELGVELLVLEGNVEADEVFVDNRPGVLHLEADSPEEKAEFLPLGPPFEVFAIGESQFGELEVVDVFPEEPLGQDINPFEGLDNVVITPHLGASTVEAQIGVSVDVAEGVMAALNGEPVPTAVNMAPVPMNVYNVIHPYFDLMERMGVIGVYLTEGPMKEIQVEYTGELADTETRLLTTAVLKGALNPILQDSVNFVNAPEVAKMRHIAVKEIKSHDSGYFLDAVTVRIKTTKGEHSVVGMLFNKNEAKIVQIDEYRVDFTPEGYLLLAPHVDQPNMIGQISTILGQARINITGMQVGRMTQAGNNIMAIAVQDDIPNDIMLKLRSIDGILDMKLIHCDVQH